MSNDYFAPAQRSDVTSTSPAPPVLTDMGDSGASVSRLAREHMPAFISRPSVSSPHSSRHFWGSTPWSALSFGLLLLASGTACIERLAWMGGH